MVGFTFSLFAISAMLFLGTFYSIISIKKPGFYPPKPILKKRAGALASGGALFFLLGLLFSIFS